MTVILRIIRNIYSTHCMGRIVWPNIYSLNAELNPICHLQALLGAHHILNAFRIRVKLKLFSKSQKNVMKYK